MPSFFKKIANSKATALVKSGKERVKMLTFTRGVAAGVHAMLIRPSSSENKLIILFGREKNGIFPIQTPLTPVLFTEKSLIGTVSRDRSGFT